jgi:hypothetical protein
MNAANIKPRSPFNNKMQSPPSSPSNANSKMTKKTIENPPSGPLNFIYLCIMYILKRLIFTNVRIKIGIYLGAILICSLMKDFNIIDSRNYLAQKDNIFNKYFVKWGWAWTLTLLTPFVLMSSIVYTGFNVSRICQQMFRLGVATFIWFAFTSLFDYIDSKTGLCLKRTITSKVECKKDKSEWLLGFDISGHIFILMHSLLLMLEEVNFFYKWEIFHKKLEAKLERANGESPNELAETSDYWYRLLTPAIKINFIFVSLLVILWEIMILTTSLFFHTILHKLIAACCAIVCWFVTYKTWYPSMSPGLPGDGLI